MNSDDIWLLITAAPLIIGILIYRITEIKTHDYRCPYCGYKIPMSMFKFPSTNMVWCGKPRLKCPKCNETSFFEIREKSKY